MSKCHPLSLVFLFIHLSLLSSSICYSRFPGLPYTIFSSICLRLSAVARFCSFMLANIVVVRRCLPWRMWYGRAMHLLIWPHLPALHIRCGCDALPVMGVLCVTSFFSTSLRFFPSCLHPPLSCHVPDVLRHDWQALWAVTTTNVFTCMSSLLVTN